MNADRESVAQRDLLFTATNTALPEGDEELIDYSDVDNVQ